MNDQVSASDWSEFDAAWIDADREISKRLTIPLGGLQVLITDFTYEGEHLRRMQSALRVIWAAAVARYYVTPASVGGKWR